MPAFEIVPQDAAASKLVGFDQTGSIVKVI